MVESLLVANPAIISDCSYFMKFARFILILLLKQTNVVNDQDAYLIDFL